MRFKTHKSLLRAAAAAGIFAAACALPPGAARAEDKPPIVMKISLAALNEALHQFAKDYAALIDKESGGRIKTEIYPASQLGSIPRQIEGTQFGAIQCVVTPPEFYSGVDERFEVMAAPGLVDTLAQAQRLTHDPEVRKLLLGLGADKGLHGVGLFTSQPSSVIAKAAIRHLADFKGKKVRVFASQFQSEAFGRLGLTPVAMTLGDVLPALQQGAIDGAIAGTVIYNAMHYQDAAKYVTNIGQPVIFGLAAVSKKWYDGLPAGFATSHRQGRRRGDGRSRSADCGDRCARRQRLGGERRRIDRPAGRRAGVDAQHHGQRRRGRVEDQAYAQRGLSDRGRGGAAGEEVDCRRRVGIAVSGGIGGRHGIHCAWINGARNRRRSVGRVAGHVASLALGARGAAAQDKTPDKTYVMKIGTPTVNDTPENS